MINSLIYNSDIKALIKKAEKQNINSDELELITLGPNRKETIVQSRIVKILDAFHQELVFSWGKKSENDIIIAQRENAAATKYQRMKRGREGTHLKMPDLDIFLGNGKTTRTIFIEAKKIGCESEVKGSGLKNKDHYEKQVACHERLKKMGNSVYLTNNPVYVRRVICEEIRRFFN